MVVKVIAGVIGIVLLAAYVLPVAWKLKEISLSVVILLAAGMMLLDFWESLKSKDD